MGLKRPWLEQGLALSLGFSPEDAEAFWITYNLKFNRNHVGYVDRAANRGGLAAEPSAMDLRGSGLLNIWEWLPAIGPSGGENAG